MKNNPLNKARELAASIVNSEEYKDIKRAEDALYSDSEVSEIYKKYLESGKLESENEEKKKIVKEYIEAAGKFNSLMRNINTIISYTIGYTGAKGDCSSCTGCKGK